MYCWNALVICALMPLFYSYSTSKISIPFILKYFTVFEGSEFLKCLNCKRVFGKQIQKVEFVKLNISVQRMTNSVEYSNIVK